MNILTPRTFTTRMNALRTGDREADHVKADKLMCELLESLGYKTGVSVFKSMKKHYA